MVQIKKKGVAEGVDWVIAAGIFLIYLGLVFVFFKPGVKSVYDYEELGNLVENSVVKNLTWSMIRTPIFIKPINFEDDNKKQSKNPTSYYTILFRTENYADLSGGTFKNLKYKNLDYTKNGNGYLCLGVNIEHDSDNTGILEFDYSSDHQGANCNEEKKFFACPIGELNKKSKEEEKGKEFNDDSDSSQDCGFVYRLGSKEYLTGINISKVKDEEYAKIKNEINFPGEKDFKIVVYRQVSDGSKGECSFLKTAFGTAKNTDGCYINKDEPPETANVFTKEASVYAMDENGALTQYTMNVRIW